MTTGQLYTTIDALGLRIDPANWRPDPERPGFQIRGTRLASKQVFARLQKALRTLPVPDEVAQWLDGSTTARSVLDLCDYFSFGPCGADGDGPLPEFDWIACYAMTGGSEGHYVHVDLLGNGDNDVAVYRLAVGKTFGGWEVAWFVAQLCAYLLQV